MKKNIRRPYKDLNEAESNFTKIYVGNLVYSMAEGDINKLFSKYGKVGKINVIRNQKTNQSTGIAFLQMFNKEHAKTAISKLDGSQVNGRTLKVSVALERGEEAPRRSPRKRFQK